MLQGLAKIAMQGRWQAAAIIAAMSLIALAIPPVSYLASGLLALSTLRAGPKEGFVVIVMTTLMFALAVTFLLNQPVMTGLFLVFSWLPVYGITLVLGYTRSLAMSILVAAGIGIVIILVTYLVLPNPADGWLQLMAPLTEVLSAQPDWDEEKAQTIMTALSEMMTGMIVAALFTNVVLGLILGRSWQAGLYNPGGFAEEFQQINFGRGPAIITALLAALVMLGGKYAIAYNCLPVLIVLFAIQGIAVVHVVVRHRQKHKGWLVAMYILLLIAMLQMVFLLALIGVLEQWFNFRQRSMEQGE